MEYPTPPSSPGECISSSVPQNEHHREALPATATQHNYREHYLDEQEQEQQQQQQTSTRDSQGTTALHEGINPHSHTHENQPRKFTGEELRAASYQFLGSPPEVEARFYRNCLDIPTLRAAIERLLKQPASSLTRDYSIQIRAYDLMQQDPVLGDLLLRYPSTLLPLLEDAIVHAQKDILQHIQSCPDPDPDLPKFCVKGDGRGDSKTKATRVHARLVHLPPSRFKSSLSRLEAKDVGQIWQVAGTVVRTSTVQMYESARLYQCKPTKQGGCGGSFMVYANVQQSNNALTPPDRCMCLTDKGQPCRGTKLVPATQPGSSVHTDYQEIKIQESSSSTGNRVGHIPRSLIVKLQHDLVDLCQPGDQVVIVGSLLAQWNQDAALTTIKSSKNQNHLDAPEPDIGLALLAHSILVVSDDKSSESSTSSGNAVTLDDAKKYQAEFDKYWQNNTQRPIQARDYICQAVCPKLYGLSVIKLSLLLTLIGGVSVDVMPDGSEPQTPSGELMTEAHDSSSGHQEDDSFAPGQQDLFVLASSAGTKKRGEESVGYEGQSRHSQQQQQQKASKMANIAKQKSGGQVYTRRRSQSHILLVGDPGTGKSQFLRFAASLCPRAVLTTGVGTTSAGLTCAAVRSAASGEFALEAGALVLADQGVCCIDEFGTIREQDRTTIHEAMEQQHLSVAKGGIVCKLNCRATIIAVMNPRDCLYDNQLSLAVNTGLGSPLLSRFDLIFKLIDTSDAMRDERITTYLLDQAIYGNVRRPLESNDPTEPPPVFEEPWPIEKLRAYIGMVKERFCPVVTDEAAMLLELHYKACRASQSRTIPVTVRFLESLIRLSQAHARLMYRDTVTLLDAVAVIRVMECSAFCYGGFDGTDSFEGDTSNFDPLYSDPMAMEFTEHADRDMCFFEYRILKRYDLLDLMSHDRRMLAEQTIVPVQGGTCPQDWSEYYAPNLAQPPAQTQNSWYSQAPLQHSQPTNQNVHPNQFTVEDHYGRTHFSQVDPSANKRHRHS